jgi:N-acetylneuraminate synthase
LPKKNSIYLFEAKNGHKFALPEEASTIAFAFASVVAIKNIEIGEVLSDKNIWVKRPSGGDFSARDYDSLLGKIAKNKISSGYQIKSADINL